MAALRSQAGSYDITPSKAKQVLSKVENYAAITHSPNVSTHGRKRKAPVEFSSSPMKRRRNRGAVLRETTNNYQQELSFLKNFDPEYLRVMPGEILFESLKAFDPSTWVSLEFMEVLKTPLAQPGMNLIDFQKKYFKIVIRV